MKKHQKLIGTYVTPAVRKGDRVTCLYRDADCVVTGFHDRRIVWPRVQTIGQKGGSGLWVNDELERAIRTESAAALMYWFGVGSHAVWKWRKAFGVSGTATTEGSKKVHLAACQEGGKRMKEKEWTNQELDAKSEIAKQTGIKPARWTPTNGGWTQEELALLGIDHDPVIAERIGRTRSAVTSMRVRLKIQAFSRNPVNGRPWTKGELKKLGKEGDEVIADQIGRTSLAVKLKRNELGIPVFQDRRRNGYRVSTVPRVGLKWSETKPS